MNSLLLIMASITLAGATGAAAQGVNHFRLPPPETESFARPDLSLRLNEVIGPDGSRRLKRGIIAGVDVAPATTVGIGLFDTMPKAKGSGADPRYDARAKRSRNAAVGMSLRF